MPQILFTACLSKELQAHEEVLNTVSRGSSRLRDHLGKLRERDRGSRVFKRRQFACLQ